MRRARTVWLVVLVVVVTAAGLAGAQVVRVASRRAAVPPYSTAVASLGTLEVVVTGTGTLRAGLQQNALAASAGTVERVLVRPGGTVAAGQTLLILSSDTLADQVEQARLQLRLAEADLASLTRPAESLATEADVAAARAGLEAARLAFDRARQNLEDLSVSTPFAGRVSGLGARPGDSVPPGYPLFMIATHDRLKALLSVPEGDLASYRVGAAVRVTVIPTGRSLDGQVVSVAAQGTAGPRGTAVYQVTVTLDGSDPNARGGMSVTAVPREGTATPAPTPALPAPVSGVLAYDRLQTVTTATGGTVTAVLAGEDDVVAAGEIVVTLESEEARVAFLKAEADLARAEHALRQLTEPGPPAVTQAQLEKARLRVEEAALRLTSLERQLGALTVTADFDGVVTEVFVSAGDPVTPGQRLVSVADLSSVTAALTVDELEVAGLATGQTVTVRMDALPGETFRGTVESVSLEGLVRDGATSYAVRVSLTPDPRMRVGMSLSATIHVARRENALLIPVEAVYGSGRDATVQVVVDGRPVARQVVAGLSNNAFIEILEGLSEGEVVVTGSLQEPTGPFGRSTHPGTSGGP